MGKGESHYLLKKQSSSRTSLSSLSCPRTNNIPGGVYVWSNGSGALSVSMCVSVVPCLCWQWSTLKVKVVQDREGEQIGSVNGWSSKRTRRGGKLSRGRFLCVSGLSFESASEWQVSDYLLLPGGEHLCWQRVFSYSIRKMSLSVTPQGPTVYQTWAKRPEVSIIQYSAGVGRTICCSADPSL